MLKCFSGKKASFKTKVEKEKEKRQSVNFTAEKGQTIFIIIDDFAIAITSQNDFY